MNSLSIGPAGIGNRRYDRHGRSQLVFEQLEMRCLLAVAPMSPFEVHMLQLINLARANPDQAAARYSTPLNQGLPGGTITSASKPPLARNDLLRDAMQMHLEYMRDNNVFTHTGSGGSTFIQRLEAAGYTPWLNVGENLVWYGTTLPLTDLYMAAEELVKGWFQSPDHRENLMSPVFKEVGSSIVTGQYAPAGTTFNAAIGGQLFGTQSGDSFLTGAGCKGQHFTFAICDASRPVAQATVTAIRQGDAISRSTTTATNGDYDLQLPDGTWDITVTAAGYKNLTLANVAIAAENVKLDLMPEILTPWKNPNNAMDVTADTVVAPNDAIRIIDDLNLNGSRPLPVILSPPNIPPPFFDTTGDNFIAPGDAVAVIDYLTANARLAGKTAEGESGSNHNAAARTAELIVSPSSLDSPQLQMVRFESVVNASLDTVAPRPTSDSERAPAAATESVVTFARDDAACCVLTPDGGPATRRPVNSESMDDARTELLNEVFREWTELFSL